MADIPDSFVSSVEKLVRERAPGWLVEVRKNEAAGAEAVSVALSHPFSYGANLTGLPSAPLTLEVVESILASDPLAWEIEVLSEAPEPRNPQAVRQLRNHAELFAWTNEEAKAVASMVDGLSDEEYEWVDEMVGHGAPGLRRPKPQPFVVERYRYRLSEGREVSE